MNQLHTDHTNTRPFALLYATVSTLLLIAALFVCQTAFVWGFGHLTGMNLLSASRHGMVVAVATIATGVVLSLLCVLLAYWRDGRRVWQVLGVRPFYWRSLAVCLWWLSLFLVVSEFVTHALGRTPMAFMDALMSTAHLPLLVVAMVVVAPIYEELIFRGVLFDAWHQVFARFGENIAIICASMISSALFAVVHLQYAAFEMGMVFGLSLVFCYARVYCRSLIAPILLHIFNNGLAMAMYLFYVS